MSKRLVLSLVTGTLAMGLAVLGWPWTLSLLGVFKGENFYEGRPTTYWSWQVDSYARGDAHYPAILGGGPIGICPLDSMPVFFYCLARIVPTTWIIDAARGVILRGAGWHELQVHALVLWGMALALILISTFRFRKRLA